MTIPKSRYLRSITAIAAASLSLTTAACGDDVGTVAGTTTGGACDPATLVFEAGDATGHADPFGAKAAGEARAGRIEANQVPQPKHGRQRIEDGDFVLVNDQVAIFIEGVDVSDGYGRFGGEIVALDRVGPDGRPLGLSEFMETLQATSLDQVKPDSVTVLADGSDGGAAIVRAVGRLTPIPFLTETFGAALPKQYEGLLAVYDYVLEPGAEKLSVRFGFANPTETTVDSGVNFDGSFELYGFFQASFNKRFTSGPGFGPPSGKTDFVAFENGGVPFAYMAPAGEQLEFGGVEISGFAIFAGEGMAVLPCSQDLQLRHEIVIGLPDRKLDGLIEVVRRARGESPWRAITGVVRDASGAPVADAFVHVTDAAGYQNRVSTSATGAFSALAPDGAVTLFPQKQGYPKSAGIAVAAGASTMDLGFAAHAQIHVTATDAALGAGMPVRIQVLPAASEDPTAESFGMQDEVNGRLWQEFSVSGDATLAVPPGAHRVIVSRGYEYELVDTEVTVAAGQTAEVLASLERSVDAPGALSADFHIHSAYSADSSDPVEYKVRGALADGLELPISSEHEWIIDFQPYIEQFGATAFAHGFPSEELTTFTWGHFGVVPLNPRPDKLNNGAMDWLDKSTSDIFAEIKALPENPAIIVNHPSGSSAFSSYFTKVSLDRATGSSTDPLWDESFDAIEVFNDSDLESNRENSLADWFSLLNAGKAFWAVGSSDSHGLRTSPTGYPRTYLLVGYDDPNLAQPDHVRDAIVQGRAVVSGGMYMTVEGPSGAGPGDVVVSPGATADFTITVRSPSWIVGDSLEVIVNGQTADVQPLGPVGAGPGNVYVNQISVAIPSGPRAWVIFHAKGMGDLSPVHPGRRPFAVSNPVLFEQ